MTVEDVLSYGFVTDKTRIIIYDDESTLEEGVGKTRHIMSWRNAPIERFSWNAHNMLFIEI